MKYHFKSKKGITGVDIALSITIFIFFIGVFSTLSAKVYKKSSQVVANANATAYITNILEAVDMIQYDSIVDGKTDELANYAKSLNMPAMYKADITVKKISEYMNNPNLQDVIKIVEVNMTYTLQGETRTINIKRLRKIAGL